RFPTPERAAWLSVKRLTAWLASIGYCGRTPPETLYQRLTTAPAAATGADADTAAAVTAAFVAVLRTLTTQIEALAARISEQLDLHPDQAIFTSLPRSGRVRAARLLAEIGDARGRFPTADSLACLAGVAPSTRQSGKVEVVSFRWGADRQLRDAICDFAGDSRHANPWAADPTTPTATARSNASSTKINRRRLDTGQLTALPRCARSASAAAPSTARSSARRHGAGAVLSGLLISSLTTDLPRSRCGARPAPRWRPWTAVRAGGRARCLAPAPAPGPARAAW